MNTKTALMRKMLRQQTRQLRQAISAMDFLASGHLHSRTKVCGQPNCRCATDPTARHGPYFEWSRRKDGKQIHSVLSKEQAEAIASAIENYRQVMVLLKQWEQETEHVVLQRKNGEKY